MRISSKLALGFTVTTIGILGAYGHRQLRQEEDDLESVAVEHLRLLGTAVAAAVEDALRDEQHRDVRGLLDSLEARDPAVDVFVFQPTGAPLADSAGSAANAPLAQRAAESARERGTSELRKEGEHTSLVLAIPLGSGLGTVVLVKPLDSLRRDLAATRATTFSSIATLIVALSSLGWLLVLLSVRRPLGQLTGAMERVRAGDLTARAPAERSDEVGDVAREFNAMVAALSEAQARLVSETESRRLMEKGLQRVDKLVTVGQLAAGLAHEIGSPLQVLNGRARLLAARSEAGSEVRRNADILVEQSDRVAGIVERLLDFARRKQPDLRQVDLRGAVRAVVDLLEVEVRRRGVVLELEAASELPTALADEAQVQQVVMNLLGNALRATPAGKKVRVQLAPGQFAAAGFARPSVAISVLDEGEGIPQPLRERIFEPFFTTWADGKGTGLGLAIVKSIVEEHDGLLELDAPGGHGTRFTVHFPQQGRARPKEQVA